MKNLFYIFILLFFSCTQESAKEKEDIDLNINFNTSASVIFHYKNAPDSFLVKTSTYNSFPSQDVKNDFFISDINGRKQLTISIQKPQELELYFGETSATCFLIPNDTLEIYLDLDTTKNILKSVKFKGKYASIGKFYKDKAIHLGKSESEINYSKALAFNFSKTIPEYVVRIDSISNNEIDFIKKHKKFLPNWFIDYTISEIKNSNAEGKISLVWFREYMNGIKDTLSESFYSDIDKYTNDSSNSILSSSYFNYLRSRTQLKSKQSHDSLNPRTTTESHEFFINESVQNLPQNVSDIFLTKSLDMLINFGQLSDTTFLVYYKAIENQEFKSYLKDSKENSTILKPEENAPPFMLPDINNKIHKLNEFKGNIVYLTFWFTGCALCRKELPIENELVEKFKSQNVKIVNICTTTPIENWRLATKKYDLKMINLYANDTIDNFIEKNFGITGYPHHVLIDVDGKIIQNKCAGPNEIESKINQLLNND